MVCLIHKIPDRLARSRALPKCGSPTPRAIAGTSTFQVNALGQRVQKTTSSGDSVFVYDLSGHLIEQADATGTVKRELLYLGDIPVGVV